MTVPIVCIHQVPDMLSNNPPTMTAAAVPKAVTTLCPVYIMSTREDILPTTFACAERAKSNFVVKRTWIDRVLSFILPPRTPEIIFSPSPEFPGVPLYYHVDESDANDPHVSFITMYAKDGGYLARGGHVCDVEFVRFHFDPNTLNVRRAYYAAHGRNQGTWVDGKDLRRDRFTGRPLVFVSISSHACYPKPGVWVRAFGFASDCAGGKLRWEPFKSSDGLLLQAMPDAEKVRATFGDGYMQWHAASRDLKGAPRNALAAFLYRWGLPLSERIRK